MNVNSVNNMQTAYAASASAPVYSSYGNYSTNPITQSTDVTSKNVDPTEVYDAQYGTNTSSYAPDKTPISSFVVSGLIGSQSYGYRNSDGTWTVTTKGSSYNAEPKTSIVSDEEFQEKFQNAQVTETPLVGQTLDCVA